MLPLLPEVCRLVAAIVLKLTAIDIELAAAEQCPVAFMCPSYASQEGRS